MYPNDRIIIKDPIKVAVFSASEFFATNSIVAAENKYASSDVNFDECFKPSTNDKMAIERNAMVNIFSIENEFKN